MAYVLFLCLCAIWGTNFILMKKAGLWFPPLSVGALRVVGGTAVLLLFFLLQGRRWTLRRSHLVPLLLVAMFGYAWPFAIQPWLIVRCGSGFIGMMVSFVPLLTILVSIPMLGVLPTPRQLFGVVGGLACVLLILTDGIDRQIAPLNLALAVTVPLVYAICNTYIKRRFVGVAPLPLALCCLSLSMAVMVPLAVAEPVHAETAEHHMWQATLAVLALGVLGTGCGALGFTKLLQDHGPLFAGMVTYLIPTIALIWGWADGEPITRLQLVALAGVLSMVALVQFGSASAAAAEA